MAGTFSLEVVTPDRHLFRGEVVSLRAPGLDGQFGVLHSRAPLLAGLGPGAVLFTNEAGETTRVAISGGFFEVANNRAVVLADAAQLATEIDLPAAAARLEAAAAARLRLVSDATEAERLTREYEVAEAWHEAAKAAQREARQ